MSRNLPWMRFFVGDWLNDPRLSLCSPSTRGVWIDLIAAMHIDGREGEITATEVQLARLCRCSPDQVLAAIDELESTGAAQVTRAGNGLVTVLCRRMAREAKARSQALERVKRHREKTCNAVVRATRAHARARSESESESESEKDREPKAENQCVETAKRRSTPAPAKSPIAWSAAAGWQGITDTEHARLAAAYPACDIGIELRRTDAWLRANPERSHRANWLRFLTNWISRQQDHGGSHGIQTRRGPAPRDPAADAAGRRNGKAAREYASDEPPLPVAVFGPAGQHRPARAGGAGGAVLGGERVSEAAQAGLPLHPPR